jgi:hypothetical protein
VADAIGRHFAVAVLESRWCQRKFLAFPGEVIQCAVARAGTVLRVVARRDAAAAATVNFLARAAQIGVLALL